VRPVTHIAALFCVIEETDDDDDAGELSVGNVYPTK
jgi:hypothetical protein